MVLTPVEPFDGVGEVGAAGGPTLPAVENDQMDEVAIMFGASGVALVRETTFQKYVVPPCSGAGGVHEYVVGGSSTICAGTLATSVMLACEVPR